MTLAIPTIHLNGTSRESLLQDLIKALEALTDATDAVQKCSPNARDYYVQGNEAFPLARSQHEKRLQALYTIRDELEQIALAIDA
jgi:hypothetical protein